MSVSDAPLEPRSRRRDEYEGGEPIVMLDGFPWRFYEPTPAVRDVRGEGGVEGRMIAWNFGEGLDVNTNESLGQGFHKILGKIYRAENDRDRTAGYLEAAWLLMARNYEVSADEFEDLILLRGVAANDEREQLLTRLREHVDSVAGQVEILIAAQAGGH